MSLIITLLLAFAAAPEAVSLSDAQRAAVAAYGEETRKLEAGEARASVERVFAVAIRIRELLGYAPGQPSIEDLSESDFAALERQLPGIILNRVEIILAHPDPEYFRGLASKYGGEVDQEFFELLGRTFPDRIWPVYLEQQTDVTGCTAFGYGRLVGTYAAFTQFKERHPGRYGAELDRILRDVDEALDSTCACGDEQSVLRELEEFAARFPGAASHDRTMKRILELKHGTSPVRFGCVSG